MKFRFIWIGKTKDKHWKALQEEYLQRLSHFVRSEICEIKDPVRERGSEAEGKLILAAINQNSFKVALDTGGEPLSSYELSDQISHWQDRSLKEVSFIIGGSDGLSASVRENADHLLSLSFLTFTHEMARVVLLEQLYRGYSIIKGFPYQK